MIIIQVKSSLKISSNSKKRKLRSILSRFVHKIKNITVWHKIKVNTKIFKTCGCNIKIKISVGVNFSFIIVCIISTGSCNKIGSETYKIKYHSNSIKKLLFCTANVKLNLVSLSHTKFHIMKKSRYKPERKEIWYKIIVNKFNHSGVPKKLITACLRSLMR